jgi:hypothetical protein
MRKDISLSLMGWNSEEDRYPIQRGKMKDKLSLISYEFTVF